MQSREEVLREPGLIVGNKLDHYNAVMDSILDIMSDLEEAQADDMTHLKNRELGNWESVVNEAEDYYRDAIYIMELMDLETPEAGRSEKQVELGFEWENPSGNRFYDAYQQHERQREKATDHDVNEFIELIEESLRYRELLDKAQEYDLPYSKPLSGAMDKTSESRSEPEEDILNQEI